MVLHLFEARTKSKIQCCLYDNKSSQIDTEIKDNVIIACGGEHPEFTYLRNTCAILIKNSSDYTLRNLCKLNIGRTNNTLKSNNNYIYCIGGFMGQLISECEKLDNSFNAWKFIPSLNSPNSLISACVFDNIWLYVLGGTQSYKIERIDLRKEEKWEILDSMYVPFERKCYGLCFQYSPESCLIIGGELQKNEILIFNKEKKKFISTKINLNFPAEFWGTNFNVFGWQLISSSQPNKYISINLSTQFGVSDKAIDF